MGIADVEQAASLLYLFLRGERAMKCPVCGKPTRWKDNPDRPFCSERCRMIDLGNWVTESYAIHVPLTDIDESVEQRIESPEGSDA